MLNRGRSSKSPYEDCLGQALATLAESRGWRLARIKGSHHVYAHRDRTERLVIPMHGNRPLKIGLQRALMKIIPVSEAEL